jgi:hypothetical protein
MFIHGIMYENDADQMMLDVRVFNDDKFDSEILEALRQTNRSYSPHVTWDEELHCYRLEASWDPNPDWGDDFVAIERRLRRVVPVELISVRWERPNEPVFEEAALVDIELP